jgi:transketolase
VRALAKAMADAVCMLAIHSVDKAKSGQPCGPAGLAEIAVAPWHLHLKHHPRTHVGPGGDTFCSGV